MRLDANQIARCTGGTFLVSPLDPCELLTGVTWDSRDAMPKDLYVALIGERVDGHDFVSAALRAGARAALVMHPLDEAAIALARELGCALINVSDTLGALSDLARTWRSRLTGRVIALTGSTGKTTTKNLIRDVVASTFSVTATVGNQNNELGVPKTILAAQPETEVVIVEMGMRKAGQIAELCDLVRPDWGLVVNVGESHIELLGSRENIARAKAELWYALPAGAGRAFVNAADDYADFMSRDARLDERGVETVLFDGAPDAASRRAARDGRRDDHRAVWAERIELDGQGRPHFELHAAGFDETSPEQMAECTVGLRGLHNVANACAAAAVGCACGMSLSAIAAALVGVEAEAGRQELVRARAGFTVVHDAYNANPDSMRAALRTFCALEAPGRRIAVLGDMGELGDFASACHEDIGLLAATLPLDRLICIGSHAASIADGARRGGMDEGRIVRAETIADVLGELDTCVEPEDVVLVKASRFMGLERVVEGLVD